MAVNTHEDWQSIQNQFYNATKNSYKKFYILSADHLSKLKNGVNNYPICTILLNRYEPLHLNFTKAMSDWQNANNFYKAATSKVDSIQTDLVKQVGIWEVNVLNVYYLDTPEYITLFPNGRSPFQIGGREQRIMAVETLATALQNYPLLSNLQSTVANFLAMYKDERDKQQQLEQTIPIKSKEIEDTHAAAADMMNRNLALLINEFGTDYLITSFFELDIIRNINQNDNEDMTSNKIVKEDEANYDISM